MAHYEDLVIDQGTDALIEVHLCNPDRSAKDLNGYTVAAKLAPSYDAVDSDKTTFSTAVLSPATDGKITLALSSAQTDLLNPRKRYVYDVEITHNDGVSDVVERVLEGKITVTPSVT
jgi:hypothetical protein